MDASPATETSWHAAFLAALAATGNVSGAARAAGISRQAAYLRRSHDADFRAAWDDALEQGADGLEAEARRRAVEGVEEPVFAGGVAIGTVRRYSDPLLIALLRAHRPEKFGSRTKVEMQADIRHEEADRDGLDVILRALGWTRSPETADAAIAAAVPAIEEVAPRGLADDEPDRFLELDQAVPVPVLNAYGRSPIVHP